MFCSRRPKNVKPRLIPISSRQAGECDYISIPRHGECGMLLFSAGRDARCSVRPCALPARLLNRLHARPLGPWAPRLCFTASLSLTGAGPCCYEKFSARAPRCQPREMWIFMPMKWTGPFWRVNHQQLLSRWQQFPLWRGAVGWSKHHFFSPACTLRSNQKMARTEFS